MVNHKYNDSEVLGDSVCIINTRLLQEPSSYDANPRATTIQSPSAAFIQYVN